MTDQEKIEKLAKWYGWEIRKNKHGEKRLFKNGTFYDYLHAWNPLEYIADAWMLIEQAKKMWGLNPHLCCACDTCIKWLSVQLTHLYDLTASEAAREISETLLKVIK